MPPVAEAKLRGGARGGRGRGGSGARGGRRKNMDKENNNEEDQQWAYDESAEVTTKTPTMFPDIFLPRPPPPTALEKFGVEEFRKFRRRVREGPLYTVLGENVRIGKSAPRKGHIANPFEEMPSYTQRYKQTAREFPEFVKGTYSLKLFPRELWDVVDPSLRSTKKLHPKQVKRPLLTPVSNGTKTARPNANEDDEEQPANEDNLPNADDDEVVEEEDPDENFEEGDSEMGGDYDAEQYFDGGDEDFDEGGGDDGGGGGDDYD